MYYTFFNSNVSLLSKNGLTPFKKSSDEKYYYYEHGVDSYNTVDFRLLPKSLRNTVRDVYWVDCGEHSLLLHSYGVTPSVLVTSEDGKRSTKKVNELVHGNDSLLFHNGEKVTKVSDYSVSYLRSFEGKSYLSNYVLHVPNNTNLVVNGFFISG